MSLEQKNNMQEYREGMVVEDLTVDSQGPEPLKKLASGQLIVFKGMWPWELGKNSLCKTKESKSEKAGLYSWVRITRIKRDGLGQPMEWFL